MWVQSYFVFRSLYVKVGKKSQNIRKKFRPWKPIKYDLSIKQAEQMRCYFVYLRNLILCNMQCFGVVIVDEHLERQCCYLAEQTIHYRQPGEQILYYMNDAELKCKKGWTGQNCDSCVTNFEPPGECSRCRTGWTGEDCDACADGFLPPTCDQICDGFGCCNHGNCQGCIQNGRWEGTFATQALETVLTFRGDTCTELVPG